MPDRIGSISIEPVTPTPSPQPRKKRSRKRPVPPKRRQAGPKFSKTLLVVLISIFLIGCYAFIGFWGIPKYITTVLPEKFHQQSGMLLQFGQVKFSPLSFDLKISDITIREDHNGKQPLFALQSFSAALAPFPLLQGRIVATRLTLDTFEANLIRKSDGEYNFSIPSRNSDQSIAAAFLNASELPFLFSLNNISVTNGRLTFQDRPKNSSHVVEKIQLALPNLSNFSFQATDYIHPSFSAIINGSPIELTGQATLAGNSDTDGLQTELSCNFNAIDLPRYFGYLPFRLPLDITSGMAEGTLKLTFAQSSPQDGLSVDFTMQVADMMLAAQDKGLTLQAPAAKFEGSIQPVTGDAHLRSIVLREPAAHVNTDFSFSQFRNLAGLSTATKTDGGAGENRPEVTIDLFQVDNGAILLAGDTPETPRDRWHAVQLKVQDYANTPANTPPGTRATFRLHGEQDDTGATFNWQGHLDGGLFPAGDLHVTDIAAAQLFTLLGLHDIQVQTGSADLRAHVRFENLPGGEVHALAAVEEGTLTLRDLRLGEDKHIWYTAPETKITGFSKLGTDISLGSVYLKNSTMSLHTDSLPAVFRRITAKENTIGVEAVDFSGTLTLADSDGKRPELRFTDVSLQAIHLSRSENASARDNLTCSALLGDTGKIQAKGKVRLASFATTLTAGFSGVESAQILPWFGKSTLIPQITARLAGKGSFSFPDVGFSGQLLLQNGKLSDNHTSYFSWKEIACNDFRYNRRPLHLGASKCNISSPQLSWTYEADGSHLQAALSSFFTKHLQPNEQPANTKQGLAALELQNVTISDGEMQITDNRLSPAWSGEVTGLNGSLEKITSLPTDTPSRYAINGLLDSVPFALNGSIHLFDPNKPGVAEFTLKEYPLPSFHRQIANLVDIDSSRGNVSVTVKSSWQDGVLSQDSDLVFTNVEPISVTADSALPLALIQDAENRFTLSTETARSLGHSPTPVFADAVTAFRKLMIKAAVSPLLLATGDFTDLVGQEYAEFLPGQIVLSGRGQESVARFSNLLSAHPAIGITVTGSADLVIDAEAMKSDLEQAEQQRVEEENRKRSLALEQATTEYLRTAEEARRAAGQASEFIEQDIPPELFARYAPIKPEPVVIDESMLQQLAAERARIIVDFFTDKLALDPQRITIAGQPLITGENGFPGNRVLFTIGTFTIAPESGDTPLSPPATDTDEY